MTTVNIISDKLLDPEPELTLTILDSSDFLRCYVPFNEIYMDGVEIWKKYIPQFGCLILMSSGVVRDCENMNFMNECLAPDPGACPVLCSADLCQCGLVTVASVCHSTVCVQCLLQYTVPVLSALFCTVGWENSIWRIFYDVFIPM